MYIFFVECFFLLFPLFVCLLWMTHINTVHSYVTRWVREIIINKWAFATGWKVCGRCGDWGSRSNDQNKCFLVSLEVHYDSQCEAHSLETCKAAYLLAENPFRNAIDKKVNSSVERDCMVAIKENMRNENDTSADLSSWPAVLRASVQRVQRSTMRTQLLNCACIQL